MRQQGKLRDVIEWAGIILFAAAGVFLLQEPLTRPWAIALLAAVTALRGAHLAYQLVRRQRRFDRATFESLAMFGGMICLIVNLQWDRPILALAGCLLMLGGTARAWHQQRRVSDSSGPIAS